MRRFEPSADELEFLRSISSSETSDALVALGYRHGGYLEGIRMMSPGQRCQEQARRVCGPVVTVKLVLALDKTSARSPIQFADANENGKIMFVSQPKGTINAVWGGLMSARALHLGAAGVVVDGQIRDLSEHLDSDFTVFARGNSPLPAKGQTQCSEINVPVEHTSALGTVHIRPGDYVIGDADGAVVLPVDLIPDIVRTARKGVEGDNLAMEALRGGSTATDAFSTFRGR